MGEGRRRGKKNRGCGGKREEGKKEEGEKKREKKEKKKREKREKKVAARLVEERTIFSAILVSKKLSSASCGLSISLPSTSPLLATRQLRLSCSFTHLESHTMTRAHARSMHTRAREGTPLSVSIFSPYSFPPSLRLSTLFL